MSNATKQTGRISMWYLLLLLSYIGLLFPQFYARTTPTLLGFPFFYWYQFSWVILSSIITAIVYIKTDAKRSKGRSGGSR